MLLRRYVRTLSKRGIILSLSTDSSNHGNTDSSDTGNDGNDEVPHTKSTQIPFEKVKKVPTMDKDGMSESGTLSRCSGNTDSSDNGNHGSGDDLQRAPSFREEGAEVPDEETAKPQFTNKFGESLPLPFEKPVHYVEQRDEALSEDRDEVLSNLTSLLSIVNKHGAILNHPLKDHTPIRDEDFFNVKSLFTLRDLFDNRVHLGHHMGCWNVANKKYLYGTRNMMHVIDIATTEQHLWRALNLLSLVVYNGGSVLFCDNRPGYGRIVQEAARSCSERYDKITECIGHYDTLDFHQKFKKKKPDLVICSSVNNPRSQQLLLHCNKYLVPTVGILDSDVDPTNLTYVIPGNDDTTDSLLFYYKLFATAVQRAKTVRSTLQINKARESKAQ